jgi:hypothetical protein
MNSVLKPPKIKMRLILKLCKKHRTRGAEEGYKEMRRIEKRIHRKIKKEYYEEQIKQVEKLRGQREREKERESKRMCRLVNDIRKEFKPYMTVCRDSTEMILSEPSEIMERWRQFSGPVDKLGYCKYGDQSGTGRRIGK